jgi:hypothetical protein
MRYEEDLDVIRNADEAEEVEPGMEEVGGQQEGARALGFGAVSGLTPKRQAQPLQSGVLGLG